MLELILTSLTAKQQLTFLIMALILSTQGRLEGSVMDSTVLIILVSVTEVLALDRTNITNKIFSKHSYLFYMHVIYSVYFTITFKLFYMLVFELNSAHRVRAISTCTCIT